MPSNDNPQVIKQIYEAFGRGDIAFVLNVLADDVVFSHPRPDHIPWGGVRRGKRAAAEFFAALAAGVDIEKFEVREFVADNDKVVVLGWERMRVKATGRRYETNWVHVWAVKNGKVTGFEDYNDTAAIVEALRPV